MCSSDLVDKIKQINDTPKSNPVVVDTTTTTTTDNDEKIKDEMPFASGKTMKYIKETSKLNEKCYENALGGYITNKNIDGKNFDKNIAEEIQKDCTSVKIITNQEIVNLMKLHIDLTMTEGTEAEKQCYKKQIFGNSDFE